MITKRKKILSCILCFVISLSVFSGLSLIAYAESSGTTGDLEWCFDLESGVLTISGEGYGANYTSSKRAPWYDLRHNILSLVVEDGVLGIGEYWLSDCYALRSVDFGTTCSTLSKRCFNACTGLTGIELPATINNIDGYVFYGCSSLKWAIINGDNSASSSYRSKISNYLFYQCTALEEVYIASGYTAIGSRSFMYCTSLHGIVWMGGAIESVASYAFSNVTASEVTFYGGDDIRAWAVNNGFAASTSSGSCGDSLGYSYDFATRTLTLSGSGEMTSCPWIYFHYFISDIVFPSTSQEVTICDYAFMGCETLGDELSIPENISSIGIQAFFGIASTSITLNAPHLTLGSRAFGGRTYLTFYGIPGSGLYDFVRETRTDESCWKCYCINDVHEMEGTVVEPDCSHIGYTSVKCRYCDKDNGMENIVAPLGHDYYLQCRSGQTLYYNCDRCSLTYHTENAQSLLNGFADAIVFEPAQNNQSRIDSRYDLYHDGYINAKDYKVMCDMGSGRNTRFDFNMNNRNATPEAKRVYRFIADKYRYNVITGQQESTWMGSPDYEINYIQSKTGKRPAIRGFDFINDDFNGVVSRATNWWNQGGIVTICWHCSKDFDKGYEESKADELTSAQWEAIFTEGTVTNAKFIAAMDKAGYALKQLQDAGVPVLWRPFHEFDGGWFWWGKGGSENFRRLWIMMYNHYTYDLGLNNLIWVLGYSHNGNDYGANLRSWYPGNEYCDIIGADTYEVAQNGAELRLFNPVKNVCNGTKPMAMHECGKIPTVSQFQSVRWGFFMTWHTTYLTDENTDSALYSIYNSDYAITLDELPSFR